MGTFRLGRSIENGYGLQPSLGKARPRSQRNQWLVRSKTALASYTQRLLGGLDARYYDEHSALCCLL